MVDPLSVDSIAAGIQAVLSDRVEAKRRANVALAALEGQSATEIAARYADIYRKVSER
jgi:hypothetical protein